MKTQQRHWVPAFAGTTVWLLATVSSLGCAPVPRGQVLPAIFEHDRVFVEVRDAGQPTLRFYTDSGGGWNTISESTAKRLDLPSLGFVQGDDGTAGAPLVAFPTALASSGIPLPLVEPLLKGGLAVVPQAVAGGDGFLGSRWFAGRVWEFDYVNRSLRSLTAARPSDRSHEVDLGFRQDNQGKRDLDFPRLTVSIDGESLEMLLDTGATATVTADAAGRLDVPTGAQIATSFITQTTFDHWSARHPEWAVVANGDQLGRNTFPMIEVPAISIAGLTVGPAWFAQRPDAAFHEFMSSMTDRPIEGAIGGSVFHFVRMTLDYPAAKAFFEAPRSVGASAP